MGFLKSFLGGSKEAEAEWEYITQPEELEYVFQTSNERPQLILKHSRSCGVSFFAKKNIDSMPLEDVEQLDRYMVDVLHSRDISQMIAENLKIRHESPQAFMVRNGEVIWHASHGEVNKVNVLRAYLKAMEM